MVPPVSMLRAEGRSSASSAEVAWVFRVPGTAAVSVVLGLLLWLGGGVPSWQASLFTGLLVIAGTATLGVVFLRRVHDSGPNGRLRAGPAAAMLLLLGILLVSSIDSEYSVVAFRRFAVWIGLGAWFYLIARGAGRSDRRFLWIVTFLAAFGAGGSLLAVLDVAWRGGARPHLPLENPNLCGALAGMTLPLLIVLAIRDKRRPASRLTWLLLVAPALVAVVLSRSTAALLTLAAGGITVTVGAIALRWWPSGERSATVVAAGFVILALLVPVLAGAIDPGDRSGPPLVSQTMMAGGPARKISPAVHWSRLLATLRGNPDQGIAARMRYARATLEALRDRPLHGFGPASVPPTFARYRLQVPGRSPRGEAVGQLHAVGLQRLYESGVAGLAAFGALVLACLWPRRSPTVERTWLRIGVAGSVAALGVAGVADALESNAILPGFAITLLALLAAEAGDGRGLRRSRLTRVAGGVAVLLSVVTAVGVAEWGLAQREAELAVESVRRAGFDETVLRRLQRAERLDRATGLYAQQAAYAAEELALERRRGNDAAGARRLFERAESLYLSAARRFPDIPGFASQAGNFLLDRDRPEEAIAYLRKGIALDYYDPLGHFYLGEAFRLTGREQVAIDEYALSVRYYPRIVGAELWSVNDNAKLRRKVLERVRALLVEEITGEVASPGAVQLRTHVEGLLAPPPPDVAHVDRRSTVLVHRLDAVPGISRSRHLFHRDGFTIENLPVAVIETERDRSPGLWDGVLEGLPVLTAHELESGVASKF